MLFQSLGVAMMLFFAHDCDKTVVYYDDTASASASPMSMALPSSATGKVGYVHELTLHGLESINEDGTPIICVSGGRAATMATRQPYFPMISWWVCENGGRIFKTSESKDSMEELETYKDYVNGMTSPGQWSALDSFANELKKEGWKVDREGYVTMIRVSKGTVEDGDVTSLEERIPQDLYYTYNLGYLDVQLPGLGKRKSVEWLIDTIAKETVGPDAKSDYLFFGDDDNDIEAATGSLEAFLASPRSAAMQAWKDDWEGRQAGDGVPQRLTVPPEGVEGHDGAIYLLKQVREALHRRRVESASADDL